MSSAESKQIERRGLMLVISSPSGAGKSSIAQNLLRSEANLSLSVSVTTRERRRSEVEGTHYHFLSEKEFLLRRDSGELLESAEVHGNFYGTPLAPVQTAMDEGRDMLFDVDWQGALQMFEISRADIVSIFILPPSLKELRSRLERRAEDSEEVIAHRLENARTEMRHWSEYDYVVINDDINAAIEEVRAILTAERLRRNRRLGLHEFVDELLA